MKNVAFINTYLSRGGAERVTIYLSEYFVKMGYNVTIITAEKSPQEYDLPANIKREILIDSNENFSFLKRFFLLNKRLKTALKKNNIDTAVVMGVSNCVYSVLACLMAKVRVIVSERNDPNNFNGKKIVEFISLKLMVFADDYVFQTNDAKKFYNKLLGGRGVVIPNPLLYPNIPEPCTGEREKIIVTCGRLTEQKNHKLLIEAFSRVHQKYPEYKLIIYGEGELRNQTQSLIDSLGLSGFVLLPGNFDNILEKIKNASLFVMSSDFEGMPNALIEAMAVGLPCISTDCPCGGPRELITDCENGLLVPVNDCEAMAKAMDKLLSDKELADRLSNNSINIKQKLDIVSIGNKWLEII